MIQGEPVNLAAGVAVASAGPKGSLATLRDAHEAPCGPQSRARPGSEPRGRWPSRNRPWPARGDDDVLAG